MSAEHREDIELQCLETGASSLGNTSPVQPSRQAWHPKLTPYRLLSVLLPASLGTVKTVASQQGQENEPITLEWISGVVVFIVLFNTGTYERKPISRIPAYLAWLFKYDCMDVVWWLRSRISRGALARPRYISDEVQVEEHGTIFIVTSYRLLVCATVVSIGMLKAALTYSGLSTGATWVEWTLGVIISSALYIVGLYESNTIGLWSSFFGTDRAYVVRGGLTGTSKLLFILTSLLLMSIWFFIKRPYDSDDARTSTELPVILRAYNQSIVIFIEGVFVMLFLLGAVVLFASLRSIREDLGDRLRVPLRFRVFILWVASFASSAYTSPPRTSSRHLAPTSTLAQTWATVRSLTYAFRHLLSLLVASFLIVLAFSFSAGQVYRVATGDLLMVDKNGIKRGSGWNVLMYVGLGLAGTVIIVPSGLVVAWSLRAMVRAGRDLYAAKCAPRLREAWAKLREMGQRLNGRMNQVAVRAVLGFSGFAEVESIHYAFLELLLALRNDGVGTDSSTFSALSSNNNERVGS